MVRQDTLRNRARSCAQEIEGEERRLLSLGAEAKKGNREWKKSESGLVTTGGCAGRSHSQRACLRTHFLYLFPSSR